MCTAKSSTIISTRETSSYYAVDYPSDRDSSREKNEMMMLANIPYLLHAGGMAQNGRTRGGTFHGEMDRCRENQGWTTACSGMPERDGKDQEEDSPKQAGSCWFGRPCRLATSGANL